jgi:glutamate 5-kinase
MLELNEQKRPSDLASLQARAAIGQGVLMGTYSDLFESKKCAQVLLTWDDFDNRQRYINARNTLNAILEKEIIPIINENDTISTDEIKFGDNDKLAALVAGLVQADLLVILSDVEGLYDLSGGEKKLLEEIKEITGEIEGLASGSTNKNVSRGGMIAKLKAIKIATHANIPCIIANGEMEDVLTRALEGERIGTYFIEKEEKQIAHKHWISFGAKPKGKITVDDGAKKAILEGGKSLLLPGVVAWDGHFKANDVVVVHDRDDQEIARGIINYSNSELDKIKDKKGKSEVIHRDELVLSQR